MSTRIAITLAAASLFLAVGCATGEDGVDESTGAEPTAETANESTDEAADDDSAIPALATGIDTQATGYSCGCSAGQEMQNGLCYPKCNPGYNGEGPVCWQTCISGFTDTGWFCQRNAHITSANNSKCPWYDKCGLTLKKGCSTCPSGYSNDGCTCRRDAYIYAQPSYGRGTGTVPSCSNY